MREMPESKRNALANETITRLLSARERLSGLAVLGEQTEAIHNAIRVAYRSGAMDAAKARAKLRG